MLKPKLKNMKISSSLMLTYVTALILFAGAVGVALYSMHENARSTEEFHNRPYQVASAAKELRSTLKDVAIQLEILAREQDPSTYQEHLDTIDELTKKRDDRLSVLEQNMVNRRYLIDEFIKEDELLIDARTKVLEAIQAGDYELANDLLGTEYENHKQACIQVAGSIVETADQTAREFVEKAKAFENQMVIVVVAISLAILTTVVLSWRRLNRALSEPVEAIEKAAERVAAGDLSCRVEYESSNELGRIALSMNGIINTLQGYINETDRVLGALARGQLDVEPSAEFVGDFTTIAASLKRVTASLRTAIQQISEASEQIAGSSGQMASGSQSIAQGAAEQATAIEELSANVQSIEAIVSDNADNTATASRSASTVLSAVEMANDQIDRTAGVIDSIRANTQNISQLANSIEDISFQTNILALNASVEAARAGETGHGFSIIAEEIRRLASQVNELSLAADRLSNETISSIERGNAIIDEAADNMQGAVSATQNAQSMMGSIAEAETQQLEAITQIRESTERLSDVVQENSAAAEESATIAEELAGQASSLRSLIDRFNLGSSTHDESDGR